MAWLKVVSREEIQGFWLEQLIQKHGRVRKTAEGAGLGTWMSSVWDTNDRFMGKKIICIAEVDG